MSVNDDGIAITTLRTRRRNRFTKKSRRMPQPLELVSVERLHSHEVQRDGVVAGGIRRQLNSDYPARCLIVLGELRELAVRLARENPHYVELGIM